MRESSSPSLLQLVKYFNYCQAPSKRVDAENNNESVSLMTFPHISLTLSPLFGFFLYDKLPIKLWRKTTLVNFHTQSHKRFMKEIISTSFCAGRHKNYFFWGWKIHRRNQTIWTLFLGRNFSIKLIVHSIVFILTNYS